MRKVLITNNKNYDLKQIRFKNKNKIKYEEVCFYAWSLCPKF